MALAVDWQHRIDKWEKALWAACYRPLGSVTFEGFTTKDNLRPDEVLRASFRPMPAGTAWGAKWEYGWFKTSLRVPEAAHGKPLALKFDPGGYESLVWINGTPAGSFGWGHPILWLTHSAIAGEVFELLLESYAGHGRMTEGGGPVPFGVETVPEPGDTQAVVKESTFGIWQEEIYQAALDFSTLLDLSRNLDPLSLRTARVDECLMDTSLMIDLELPEDELLETIRAGRKRMKPLLESRNGPSMPTLYAFGHAHLDVAWLWPLQHTERKMAMTILNQLALIKDYPEYRFLQSQPHLLWMLQQRYPEIYAQVKRAVASGKVIPEGGMWVEADTNISGGEALIRQILYGQAFFEKEFGIQSRVLWLPDVFGYSGALPQILKGFGMIGFATQKITWAYNGGEPFPYNIFWWEGIDGSRIATHIFTDYNSELRPKALLERWNTRLQKNGISSLLLPFGWGDGGGGPTRDHLEFYRRVQDLEGVPRVRMSSPEEFFLDLENQGLPKERYVGELYFQAHRGTYTSQARAKQGNRKSEIALREAELWSSVANVLAGYQFTSTTFTEEWRGLLLNQFHDILPGSSIERVYQEAQVVYEQILACAGDVAEAAARSLVSSGERMAAFNSLSWPRKALVNTPGGRIEVELPACGWARVPEDSGQATGQQSQTSATLTDGGFELENERILARFDSQARLRSLWDKEAQRDLMESPGNQLCLFKDVPNRWDAWDIDRMAFLQPVPCDEPVTITLLQPGPIAARVKIERDLHESHLVQVISLRRGSRRIDFETSINWQERHKLLKVCFPFAIHTNEVISEIQFGHLRRPNHQSRPFDADRFEICNHRWSALVEEGRGAAVLNDCKYGLSALGNSLNLTLLKSPLAPDMNADRGMHTFTYSVYTWNGSLLESGLLQEAYDLNVPVLVIPETGVQSPRSIFSVDAPNVVIETVKLAEDGTGDLILRLYEGMRTATRCVLSTSLSIRSAAIVDMLERNPRQLECEPGRIGLDFRPFEIKTLRLTAEPQQRRQ